LSILTDDGRTADTKPYWLLHL